MTGNQKQTFGNQVLSFGLVQIILKFRFLITIPILSRLIGTDGYGTMAALMAFCGIIQMITIQGTNTALTVFIPWAKTHVQRSREFWLVVQVVVGTAVVLTGFFLLLHQEVLDLFFPAGLKSIYLLLGLLTVPIQVFNLLLNAQIVNNHQAQPYTRRVTIAVVAELLLVVVFAYYFSLTGVLLATLAGQTLQMGLVLLLVLRRDPFIPLQVGLLKEIKKYYAYGFTMFVAGAASWVIDASDRLIIGKFLTASELGIYQVSYGLCGQIADLAAPLFYSLLPFVSSAVAEDNQDLAKWYLERSYRFLILMYFPVVVFLSLEARDILMVISTPQFYRGALIVPWVASGIALYQILGVYTYILHAHKRGQVIFFSIAVAAIVNLTLNLFFITRFGIMTAAASTLIAYIVHFVIIRYLAGRLLPIVLDRVFILKVIASTAIFWGVLMAINTFISMPITRLFLGAILGGASYIGLVLVSGCITKQESEKILSLVRGWLYARK